MKQKYLLYSIVFLLFSMISLSAMAAVPNLEITPPSQSVSLGSECTLNIEVQDVIDLKGASITLNFDASKLQYVSSAGGGFIPGAFLAPATVDNVGGTVLLDIVSLSSYASGSGNIVSVVFESIAAGDTNVSFSVTTLRDKNNISIDHTTGSDSLITINISNIKLMPELQGVDQYSQATVNVEVEDVINLQGASITLNFDPTQLQYVSSANGGFIPNATLLEDTVDNVTGLVTLDIAGLGTYNSGNGTIMDVNFQAIGKGNSLVLFGNTILRDKDNNEITHTTGDASIITIDPPVLNLLPVVQSVAQGGQVEIYIEVKDATNLQGASIALNFDTDEIQYVSSADEGFIPNATLMDTCDNIAGLLTLDIVGLGSTAYASGDGNMLSAVFQRINTGNTNITFGITQLRDKDNSPMYHMTGNPCLITSLIGDFGGPGGSPDCVVDFEDLMIFALAYGSTPSDPNWNPLCDIGSPGGSLVPDGVIDFEDLMIFAMHYGETC